MASRYKHPRAPPSVVQVRVDAKLKKQAQAALQAHELRLSDAIRLFITETARLGRLPFDAHDAPMRSISQKRLWAMKRAQQARDRAAVASGTIKPESVLLIRPDRIKGAKMYGRLTTYPWSMALTSARRHATARAETQSNDEGRSLDERGPILSPSARGLGHLMSYI